MTDTQNNDKPEPTDVVGVQVEAVTEDHLEPSEQAQAEPLTQAAQPHTGFTEKSTASSFEADVSMGMPGHFEPGQDEATLSSNDEPLSSLNEHLAPTLTQEGDHLELDDFALSVREGLGQAGITEEELLPLDGQSEEHAHGLPMDEFSEQDAAHTVSEVQPEAYFSGWGNLNAVEENTPEPETFLQDRHERQNWPERQDREERQERQERQPASVYGHSHTGSVFGGSSRTLSEAISLDRDVAVKHDALAFAVQSALSSIYGDDLVEEGQSRGHNEPFDEDQHRHDGAENDAGSPQDVILNYFSFKPKQESAPAERYTPQNFHRNDYYHEPERRAPASGGFQRNQTAARSAPLYHEDEDYDPVPRQFTSAPRHEMEGGQHYGSVSTYTSPVTALVPTYQQHNYAPPESSRLLGAAGIGLIGGIAIAATLAVFVINNQNADSDGRNGQAEYGMAASTNSQAVKQTAGVITPSVMKTMRPEVLVDDMITSTRQAVSLAIVLRNLDRPLDQTLVSVTGIPEGARLNMGVDAGYGNWLLPPKRLNDVVLSLPQNSADTISLEAQVIDINSHTPVTDKKRFVIRVVSAVASLDNGAGDKKKSDAEFGGASNFTTQTIPARTAKQETGFETKTISQAKIEPTLTSLVTCTNERVAYIMPTTPSIDGAVRPEIEDLIRQGNRCMRENDISKAREFYQKACGLGDAQAALAMGRSYDPFYLDKMSKKNADADAAKAFEWYKIAMDRGAKETAKLRIDQLKQYLSQ